MCYYHANFDSPNINPFILVNVSILNGPHLYFLLRYLLMQQLTGSKHGQQLNRMAIKKVYK